MNITWKSTNSPLFFPRTFLTCQPSQSPREWIPPAITTLLLLFPQIHRPLWTRMSEASQEKRFAFYTFPRANLPYPRALPHSCTSLMPALSCLLLLLCFFTKVSFKLFPSPFYQGSAFSYLFCPSELLNSSSGTMPGRSSGKAAAHPACGQSHAAAPAWNQTLLWRQGSLFFFFFRG